MSAKKYQYDLTLDFGGNLSESQLNTEIAAEVGITTQTFTHINVNDNDVDIWFTSDLTGGEITILDALVAAHVPHQDIGVGTYAESESESLTTSSSYQQKLRLSLANILAGDYFIRWTMILGNSHKDRPTGFRVELDDSTVLAEGGISRAGSDDLLYVAVSGFKKQTLSAGNHEIDIDYKVLDNETAKIKNARIWVSTE